MRKWIFIVVPTVILLALIVGDQAAKGWAESKLAERAAAYYPPGSGSSASIHSLPFIGRLLVSGSVPRVDVNLDDLRVDPVLIRQLSIHVTDVKLNRSDLFHGRVHLEHFSRAVRGTGSPVPAAVQWCGTAPLAGASRGGTRTTTARAPNTVATTSSSPTLFLVYAPFWAGLHNAGASAGPSWPPLPHCQCR